MLRGLFIHEKFRPLFENRFSYYGFWGGRASGKSHAVAAYALRSAMMSPEVIITARAFKSEIDDSFGALYRKKMKQMGIEDYFRIYAEKIECKLTGATIGFKGLTVNPDSLRGLEGATLTILEEAHNTPSYALEVLNPTIFRTGTSRLVALWNPRYATDPIDLFFRGPHPQANSYTIGSDYRDNPYFFTQKLAILRAQMEHMQRVNPTQYKHVWLGDYFGGAEARIFNNWKPRRIKISGIEPQYGLDFGAKRDPNAIVKLYVSEARRAIYIEREFYQPGGPELLMQGLRSVVGDNKWAKIVCDSSWPQSISLVKQEYPNACPAKKGKNSVADGIKWLQDYTIYINPDCKNMLHEAESYHWRVDMHNVNPDGSPRTLDEPKDEDNHLWDAVRYATEQNRLERKVPQRAFRLHF